MLRLHYLSLVLLNLLLAWLGFVHATPAPITRASSLLRRAQPTKAGVPGTFEEIGTTGASAQQLFLGSANKVYVIDKVENNAMQVVGHPVWATEYNVETNDVRGMDVRTNTFCAGGNVMGNGTWINVGGNKAVTYGGLDAEAGTNGPYGGVSGGSSVRFLDPCNDDDNCEWRDDPATQMTSLRWYPTLETLEDGRVIIIGGDKNGGYVNDNVTDDNPTYEYWPPEPEGAVEMQILLNSRPINLYPLTWLLPSGNLFIQAGYRAEIFDYKNKVETFIPDVPTAVRCYPASAASVMLPLVPSNNYDATLLFCGGNDLKDDQWKPAEWAIINYPASPSCVKITPDASTTWETDDDLPEGRTMGNFIILPDGKLFLVNGARNGTAGYGNETWVNGHSYADAPLQTPLIFDPAAPAGSRWSSAGLSESPIPRLYHSSATLLPDGSVFIAGSNPNPDVQLDVQYPTEYRAERFYPSYYSSPRPEPIGLPNVLGYGGDWFNVTIDLSTLGTDLSVTPDIKIIVMRFGFSTHAINFGQRYLQLNSTMSLDGTTATVHTSQMPPNAALFAPGPAWISAVVNGVPAVFSPVMVGNGVLGPQDIQSAAVLPDFGTAPPPSSSSPNNNKGAASALVISTSTVTFAAAALGAVLLAVAQL